MKQVILQHGEMITIVGALVGIGAFGYGIFRFARSEDRARLERMEAISLVWVDYSYCFLLWYSQANMNLY